MELDIESFRGAVAEMRGFDQAHRPLRSLRDAAKESGVSAATLSRIERGAMPDLLTFLKLCRWLGARAEDFVMD